MNINDVEFMKIAGGRLSQRWIFAFMGFLAILNAYTMRVCLSITITEMAVSIKHNYTDQDTCKYDLNEKESLTNSTEGKYDWDERTQGLILSSFFWGYILTHIPGGILSERFGGKYTLGLGILSTAIFTLLTPLVVQWGDAVGLIVLRVLMGLGEGTTFPALNALLAQWTPPEERSIIGSLVFAGAQLGTVFANLVSGLILHQYDWPMVFYVFGSIGVLWFVVFTLICYSNPYEHPYISEREVKFLHERMNEHTHTKPPPVPWRHMLRSAPLWALIAAQVGHDWGFFTLVTDLPKYMSSVLNYSIKSNGLVSALPYLIMWFCSIGSSWLADWMITKGIMSRTNVRKLGTTIASIGPGVFIIAASYSSCDRTLVVAMFTIGMALMGTFYPGMKVNGLDLSPNYSGTLMALVNGMGAFTGIITPYIVGELAPQQTMNQWRIVFWIVLAVFILTNAIFVMYASGEVQYWNDPDFVIRDREERSHKKKDKKAKSAEKA
ncbi:PREDICTED: putative inorganic phosphate cotransporter isoform X1 [Trachymyrmex cornetzi]|uniref:Putative inorganic phosphate cotransporter n=2 Tax=Trachymyrmex cornetzi TaxID=471704 RepID=A0A195DN90_9HYME|nr:PREDICTED: putative inorganic phosphate cotransporter isoform X1 [Trachymyrmex cornetzi]KYN14370.1 Putative inorganic phosphate cotransporter [Trachymyrmex cornetzi]